MNAYEESNMSEAARRAYEAARRAFSDAPSVPAHGWRGTLEAREANAAFVAATSEPDATPPTPAAATETTMAAIAPSETLTNGGAPTATLVGAATSADPVTPKPPKASVPAAPSTTLRDRIAAARAKQAAATDPFARAESEDDDGYDPWSDRREEPALWEEDPWR